MDIIRIYSYLRRLSGYILENQKPLLLLNSPVILLILYKIYQALWAIPRISKSPANCYILVTGCGRGFGNEIVKRLDRMGCHVFAGCRSERGIKELDEETSERCHVIKMDISNDQSIKEALEYVKSKLPPGEGLWGLINNAGVGGSKSGILDWNDAEDFREVLEVNVMGTIQVTRAFLPLIKKCRGRVVIMSSISGRIVTPIVVPYAVSKYATEGYGDALRRCLLPYGCKVCLIEPGTFKTDLTSVEYFSTAVQKSWNGLTAEEKEEFGDEYYEEFRESLLKTFNMDLFNKTSEVINAMEKALFSRYPRARYVVGNDAKFLYLPIIALPEWLSDRILSGLLPLPKPALLKKK